MKNKNNLEGYSGGFDILKLEALVVQEVVKKIGAT